jgi:hypothetical protein
MAEKTTFPMLPGAHWWVLREKFKQSIPGVVTESYLAAALNMQARSARVNILPYLRDIGLIDKENKTQELAKAWRDDAQYANVCKQIREKIYPEDLRSAALDPAKDRPTIERWFANHTGAGTSAVQRMTQFYIILLEADAKKKSGTRDVKPKETEKQPKKGEQITPRKKVPRNPLQPRRNDISSELPSISINLQIHISADATPDQIDKIFESMAKHIYRK